MNLLPRKLREFRSSHPLFQMASPPDTPATKHDIHSWRVSALSLRGIMASFIKDIDEIRERARRKIDEGAVTESYGLDKDRAISILNEALATEIVCVLRYMHHYFMATGVHGRAVADEFKEHADDEREHADEIAERIQQLGGKPDFNPASLLQRSVAQYSEGETLADMIREDLVAERTVIDVYQQMIEFFGQKDPTTRRLLEHIKAEEEEHASDLSDFLFIVDPRSGDTEGQDPGTDPLESPQGSDNVQNRSGRTQRRDSAALRRPGSTESRGADIGGSETADAGDAIAGLDQPMASRQAPNRERTRSLNVAPAPRGRGGETQPGGSGNQGKSREQVDKDERWGNLAHSQVEGEARDTRRQAQAQSGSKGELRPARDRGAAKREEREESGGRVIADAPPSNLPGVSGRPMNRRRTADDIDETEVAARPNAGGSGGTNRSPKILNKTRKGKRAA
jgi:bacterioferritin